ncbi:DUF2642 domain-containing protein [Lentibacillus sp. L22]|uniref:DUF2642 domain-containing protein n=1 Tax=Lentibacillus TaxID=175304 RepID=UPI0022B1770C|nr:DUF2642 domain-containing protein [Lentibacillus daqui]
MALTDRQRDLLNYLNQLSQSLANSGLNNDFSLNLPGLNVDFDVDVGRNRSGGGTSPTPPNTPKTMRDVLINAINEQVQITTPFDTVTGTLIAVKNDYVVLVENTGEQTLVRIDKIEFVSEI